MTGQCATSRRARRDRMALGPGRPVDSASRNPYPALDGPCDGPHRPAGSIGTMEEAQLVRGLRERRETAVASFMERYRSLLYHCIGHFEQEPSAREDLYQELVLYVLERLDADRFDPHKGSLGTWLYRVAWCRCVDLKRRSLGRSQPRPSGDAEGLPDRVDPQPDPGQLADEAELGDLVRRALVMLDEEEQDLLELRFLEECTLGEISSRLGISHEQCKYRIKRASTALRRVLLNELSLERMADAAGYLARPSRP